MKTTIAVALLGLLVACSVPTSGNQSHLRHRLVRDTQSCELQCTGDKGGNTVIEISANFKIVVSVDKGSRFVFLLNREKNFALYISLEIRVAAVINLTTKKAVIFNTDSGQGVLVTLTFNVDCNGEVEGQLYFDFAIDLHKQICGNQNRSFNFYLGLVGIAKGKSIGAAFGVDAQIEADLKASFGGLFDAVISSKARNAIVVVGVISTFICHSQTQFQEIVIRFMNRLSAAFDVEYLIEFVQASIESASGKGNALLLQFAIRITGAVQAVGQTKIGDRREWQFELESGAAYTVSIARDTLRSRWTLTWVKVGDDSGNLEIGLIRRFLFIYNKKYDYCTFIVEGRISVFNMRTGTGFVRRGSKITILEAELNIAAKWALYEENMSVIRLQVALEAAVEVTRTVEISDVKFADFEKNILTGKGLSTKFISQFSVYKEYRVTNPNSEGTMMCFIGHVTGKFQASFALAIRAASQLSVTLFVKAANLICDTLLKVSNIFAGFKISFSLSLFG